MELIPLQIRPFMDPKKLEELHTGIPKDWVSAFPSQDTSDWWIRFFAETLSEALQVGMFLGGGTNCMHAVKH